MAKTLIKSLNISESNTAYSGTYGEGSSVLQLAPSYPVGVGNPILKAWKGATETVLAGASGIVFFPGNVVIPAGARITMDFQVEYGAGDITAVNRLLTWTRDTVVVETNEEIGSFSFDTSLTVARVGTETCYITPYYTMRA